VFRQELNVFWEQKGFLLITENCRNRSGVLYGGLVLFSCDDVREYEEGVSMHSISPEL